MARISPAVMNKAADAIHAAISASIEKVVEVRTAELTKRLSDTIARVDALSQRVSAASKTIAALERKVNSK